MQIELLTPRVAALPAPPGGRRAAPECKYAGTGHDVLLQGFHWDSHSAASDGKSWYRVMRENAAAIRAAGFTWVWFPPSSDSLAPQGYIPRRWNVLDSTFGTEAELRAAIRALAPVHALADVVLNHRVGVATAGADFEDPPFPDNRAAIAGDDDSGVGTGNPDTGDHHPAGRDLDHTNTGVRATVKNYLRRLRSVGFRGWRYDLVKGFHGRFVGEYNDASAPLLSVGEFFDGDRQSVADWIDATGGRSTAFDFPTRFLLFEAIAGEDYGRLRSQSDGQVVPGGLVGSRPTRSVTFLDNHDTEYRREPEHAYEGYGIHHFPGSMVDVGYAYTLTHPGIPCVFWSHYFDWGAPTRRNIERLIRIRKRVGIHSGSVVDIKEATKGLYAAVIDGKVAVKLGARDWSPGLDWRLVHDGDRFAVWTRLFI